MNLHMGRSRAPKRQWGHSEMGDQLIREQRARIQPAAQTYRGLEQLRLTWDWTEMAISALQWEETLTQQ